MSVDVQYPKNFNKGMQILGKSKFKNNAANRSKKCWVDETGVDETGVDELGCYRTVIDQVNLELIARAPECAPSNEG